MEWQIITAKRKKKADVKKARERHKQAPPKSRKVVRPGIRKNSILEKSKQKTSYFETVRQLKSKVQSDMSGVEVWSFKWMKDEAVLVRLKKSAGNRAAFKSNLKSELGSKGEISDLTAAVCWKSWISTQQ